MSVNHIGTKLQSFEIFFPREGGEYFIKSKKNIDNKWSKIINFCEEKQSIHFTNSPID